MKYTTTYDVTLELQDASVSQFYFHVLLRPQLGSFLTIFAGILGMILFDLPYKLMVVSFFSAIVLFLGISWVKAYFSTSCPSSGWPEYYGKPKS